MYLPDFDYYAAETLLQASELLDRLGPEAKLLAGGTDILFMMKHEMISPKVLVSIKKISDLKKIFYEEGKGVVIGSLATHNEVLHSPLLQELYPSVCETAHQMANNQIRNTGTIGGNIANAVPSADFPPILIALGAKITIESSRGKKIIPLENFFLGPRQSVLRKDEILTEIIIPENNFVSSVYKKFALLRSGTLAMVGVAVAVSMNGNICNDVRIALGAVAPTPLRVKKAENIMKGKEVTEELLEEAGQIAADECRPINDIRGYEEYHRDMVRIYTTRILRQVIVSVYKKQKKIVGRMGHAGY